MDGTAFASRVVPADLWRRLARLNWFALCCALLLVAIGLVYIASAVRGMPGGGDGAGFLARQAVFLAMSMVGFVAMQKIEYPTLLRLSPGLYVFGLCSLVAVLFTRPVNGARSWFDLYLFKFQPSELFKPILILTLAYYLMYRDSYKRLFGLFIPLLLGLAPLALIMKQPDLGTAIVLAPMLGAMLYAAGARLRHLSLVGLCGAAGMVGMWFTVLKDYQKRRVLAWLYPDEYRLSEAWQLMHSIMAIGSGGWLGNGWGQSSQSGLNQLPEKHTDFIFAVVAEEGGFLTAGLILLLQMLVALSGLQIALRTREPAGRLIAVGIATTLGIEALTNSGVALGLLPTTGKTLPFVSYGGSSLISSFLCLGLLLNIGSRQDPVLAREDFAQ